MSFDKIFQRLNVYQLRFTNRLGEEKNKESFWTRDYKLVICSNKDRIYPLPTQQFPGPVRLLSLFAFNVMQQLQVNYRADFQNE